MRSASQCVWVTSGNMYKRSMCQTGFQRFQTGFGWFPIIFSGVSASSTVNLGWSLEEYVMRGHQFWTCCSHFESDPSKLQKVLGLSCQPTKVVISKTKLPNLWREPWVVRFQQDDLGLCHPPLSCRSLTLVKNVETCWKILPPKRPKKRNWTDWTPSFAKQASPGGNWARTRAWEPSASAAARSARVWLFRAWINMCPWHPLYPLFLSVCLSVVYLFLSVFFPVFICVYLCLA